MSSAPRSVPASGPGRRDRRRRAGAGPGHAALRLRRDGRQRARHPRRHRLVHRRAAAAEPRPARPISVAVRPAAAGPATRRRGDPGRADCGRRPRAGGQRRLARRARGPGVGLPGLRPPGAAGGSRSRCTKRRSFQAETYWGRPVPGLGRSTQPSILILGLAPAAHGGNRTGRIFTGDRSGDVLFASLWRCGLAVQPTVDGGRRRPAADLGPDGGRRALCAARQQAGASPSAIRARRGSPPSCSAPRQPARGRMSRSFRLAGALAAAVSRGYDSRGRGRPSATAPRSAPSLGEQAGDRGVRAFVLGCYHPSQQNTFTGRVTGAMLDAVFRRAATCWPLKDAVAVADSQVKITEGNNNGHWSLRVSTVRKFARDLILDIGK